MRSGGGGLGVEVGGCRVWGYRIWGCGLGWGLEVEISGGRFWVRCLFEVGVVAMG